MTRRPLKVQPPEDCVYSDKSGLFVLPGSRLGLIPKHQWQVGDILMLSEPVTVTKFDDEKFQLVYEVDRHLIHRYGCTELLDKIAAYKNPFLRGVLLPEAYSRPERFLVAAVKIERVQEISEEDIRKEGIKVVGYGDYPDDFSGKHLFQKAWDSIYTGDKSWNANPCVAAYTAERVME